ncbi:MAG: undecaprenyl/decaprenyl-phosphate alpha-N-acetylglucosaminyl 1-phosphate transferase [Candidatus Competibacteraceae bacterium]|nr:undecaprenyl/decaprenyl-phosphate alpha-N-acetylglucosaminyl 1-phosphate transferase [Candidatus Competibacteraceae bacterium]
MSTLLLVEWPHAHSILLVCMTLLTLVGLYDDLFSLRPAPRFLFQIGAILLMVLAGDMTLASLGNLFGWGNILLGDFTIPLTLFAVVGVINAFNMIDGLDGLAGGLALLATLCLIILNLLAPTGGGESLGALSVLALVIAGFLCFNLRHPWRTRAGVFMGDAGSTMLGFVLGWFLVHLSQGREAVMAPVTAIWIVALPLMDTVAVMTRRIRAGRSPFAADRQHLHHLLLGLGLADGRVCAILLAVATLAAAGGVLAWRLEVPEHWQFYTFLAMFGLYYRSTTRLWIRQRKAAGSIFESGRNNAAADLA